MSVRVLYFAGLRESLGLGSEEIALPDGVATLEDLRLHLAGRGEPWSALSSTRNLRAAVNQAMVTAVAPIRDGDEVAFFPPVTGG